MLRRFLRFYIPYKKVLLFTLLGAVVTSLIELFFPLYMRYIMDEILPQGNIPLLLKAAAGLLALYLFNCFIN